MASKKTQLDPTDTWRVVVLVKYDEKYWTDPPELKTYETGGEKIEYHHVEVYGPYPTEGTAKTRKKNVERSGLNISSERAVVIEHAPAVEWTRVG